MTRSLFKTLLVLMLLASAMPIGLFAWSAIRGNRDALTTNALELAQERVLRLQVQIASAVGESARAVESVVRDPGFTRGTADERRRAIASVLGQRDEVLAVTLFDAAGERVAGMQAYAAGAIEPDELLLHAASAKALLARARRNVWSDARYSASRGEPVVTLVLPLTGAGGETAGFAAAELSLAPVQELLVAQRAGPRGAAYVVDESGRLVAHRDPARLAAQENLSDWPVVQSLLAQRQALAGGSARVGQFSTGQGEKLAAFAVIPELLWGVVAEEPLEDAYALVTRMQRQAWWGLLAALLLAGLLAALFSRQVTRPLRSFEAGALQIARGQFGVQVKVQTRNELGALAETFNYMSLQLLAYDAETQGLYRSLEEGYVETIVALANSIDSKDSYTRGHSQRVGEMSAEIGRELGLPERDIRHLLYGGILHDVGKIGIAEPILCKQDRLTDEEMTVMREHPAIGGTIIEAVSFLKPVFAAVRHHHERWDGAGYPDRLAGEAIPLIARIVNCADTWDACTSTRPYQQAMPPEKALEIIARLTGTQLDPAVAAALERVVRRKQARGERISAYADSTGDAGLSRSVADRTGSAG